MIIVNETLARTLWPGQDPMGQIIAQIGGRSVVGVVGMFITGPEKSGMRILFADAANQRLFMVDLVLRTSFPPKLSGRNSNGAEAHRAESSGDRVPTDATFG